MGTMTETMRDQQHRPNRWLVPALMLTGAGLLAASAAIHLDLYLTGYRSIPTIGWLFLLQVITGFALAAAVLVTRHPLAAAAAAGFALSTLAGYLLSVWIGLFGFKEVRTTAGIAAGVIEVAAFAALATAACWPGCRQAHEQLSRPSPPQRFSPWPCWAWQQPVLVRPPPRREPR
jgi:hypothetical protein